VIRADSPFSSEMQVALAPTVTYERLLSSARSGAAATSALRPTAARKAGHYVRFLRRPALVVVVIAVMAPIMAVQRVTFGLVATAALSWSFAVLLQSLVGLAIITSAPARKIGVLPSLDLWFAGHVPYSLWMLVAFGLTAMETRANMRLVVLSAVVPAIWTAVVVTAFCQTVLDTTASGARWRAAAHFVSIWAITLSYIAWASGGWFQLLP
jgi:hypothetical protein